MAKHIPKIYHSHSKQFFSLSPRGWFLLSLFPIGRTNADSAKSAHFSHTVHVMKVPTLGGLLVMFTILFAPPRCSTLSAIMKKMLGLADIMNVVC